MAGRAAAAAQAGLSRSRYLQDRDELVRCGLLVVEEVASDRGNASTVALGLAAEGPWREGEINARAVRRRPLPHAHARARASAVAAMAVLADPDGVVRGVSSEELCAAAGVADRTCRRARRELLESGEPAVLRGFHPDRVMFAGIPRSHHPHTRHGAMREGTECDHCSQISPSNDCGRKSRSPPSRCGCVSRFRDHG
jgi:hypothetical protein